MFRCRQCVRSACESSPRLAPTGCVSLMAEPGGELRHLTGLWARAHHEAAHAVVATVMGGRVEEIQLWSGPPVGGRVRLTGIDASATGVDGYDLVRRIVYLLAGPI